MTALAWNATEMVDRHCHADRVESLCDLSPEIAQFKCRPRELSRERKACDKDQEREAVCSSVRTNTLAE